MSITQEEHDSLKRYQDSGFYWINTYLRTNEVRAVRPTIEEVEADIRNLDTLFGKQERAGEGEKRVVYRGVPCLYEGLQLGFLSTSRHLAVARKFAGRGGAVCELHVDASIPYIDTNTWNGCESEILLPRGLTLTVRSSRITKKEKYYVIDVSLAKSE